MKKIKLDHYAEAACSCMGYCTNCQDFTRYRTMPDAEEQDCPLCGKNKVIGAALALLTKEVQV